jgi:ABC-type multidrug transport system permease subunit
MGAGCVNYLINSQRGRVMNDKKIEKTVQGLRGWLILVGIGVTVAPIKIATGFPIFYNIFESGSWDILTTPGTPAYHPFWSTLLSLEILVNLGIFIAAVYLAFLFFTKKKQFPKFYIGIVVFSLVFVLIDALLTKIVVPNDPIFDPAIVKQLITGLVTVLIWVPYMVRSKRVKATFIE